MKVTPKAGVTALVLLLLVAGGVYYFVRPEPPAQERPPVEVSGPALLFEGNRLVEKKNGKVLWELEATNITVEKATGQVVLLDVQAVFYRDDGTKLNVVAKTGQFDSKTKNLQLTGEVVATSTDGAKLTADAAAWQQKEELITAKGKARLEKPDVVATADEMQTDRGLEKIRLSGNAVIVKGGK